MTSEKSACVVYVHATTALLPRVREELEREGFKVSAVEASVEDAAAAQDGHGDVEEALAACVKSADRVVFLIPEDTGQDGLIGVGAGLAARAGKDVVGVISGARATSLQVIEDVARGVIRADSARFREVICGTEEVFELPNGKPAPPKKPTRVACQ